MALNVIGVLLTRAGLLGNILSFNFGEGRMVPGLSKRLEGKFWHKKGKRAKSIYIFMMGGR